MIARGACMFAPQIAKSTMDRSGPKVRAACHCGSEQLHPREPIRTARPTSSTSSDLRGFRPPQFRMRADAVRALHETLA
jgi:hypothetical protein